MAAVTVFFAFSFPAICSLAAVTVVVMPGRFVLPVKDVVEHRMVLLVILTPVSPVFGHVRCGRGQNQGNGNCCNHGSVLSLDYFPQTFIPWTIPFILFASA